MDSWSVMEWCDMGDLSSAVYKDGLFGKRKSWRESDVFLGGHSSSCEGIELISMALGDTDLWQVLDTVVDIATGLEDLHTAGLVHCNISLSNILLQSTKYSRRGFLAKVGGLSRCMQAKTSLEAVTYVPTLAQLPYAAPEVICERVASKKGDVYAFGVVVWELLSGSPPWATFSSEDLVRRVVVG